MRSRTLAATLFSHPGCRNDLPTSPPGAGPQGVVTPEAVTEVTPAEGGGFSPSRAVLGAGVCASAREGRRFSRLLIAGAISTAGR